jgi:hypothetical protein
VQSLTVSANSLFAPGVEDDSFQIEDDMEVDKEAVAGKPPAQGIVQEAGQPVAQRAPQPAVQSVAQRAPQPAVQPVTQQMAQQPVVKITPQPDQENAPQPVEDVESKSLHHTHISSHRQRPQCHKSHKIMTHSSTQVSIISSLCLSYATHSSRSAKLPLRRSRSYRRRRRPTTRPRIGLALQSVVVVSVPLTIHASLCISDSTLIPSSSLRQQAHSDKVSW